MGNQYLVALITQNNVIIDRMISEKLFYCYLMHYSETAQTGRYKQGNM
jgi:hypothetical protein